MCRSPRRSPACPSACRRRRVRPTRCVPLDCRGTPRRCDARAGSHPASTSCRQWPASVRRAVSRQGRSHGGVVEGGKDLGRELEPRCGPPSMRAAPPRCPRRSTGVEGVEHVGGPRQVDRHDCVPAPARAGESPAVITSAPRRPTFAASASHDASSVTSQCADSTPSRSDSATPRRSVLVLIGHDHSPRSRETRGNGCSHARAGTDDHIDQLAVRCHVRVPSRTVDRRRRDVAEP